MKKKSKEQLLDSNYFKEQYFNLNKELDNYLSTITNNIKSTKDKLVIDKLLDLFNYTKTAYQVNCMNDLICYITTYLQEQNIIQNGNVPLKSSLKILLEQDWIKDDMKLFLKNYFIASVKDDEDFAQYVSSFENYIKNLDKFKERIYDEEKDLC